MRDIFLIISIHFVRNVAAGLTDPSLGKGVGGWGNKNLGYNVLNITS